jgi:hypothetical protein
MQADTPNHDLFQYLSRTRGISLTEAAQLVDEILSYFHENYDTFIQRRHRELQATGVSNPNIYQQIQRELKSRRFSNSSFSERQIRRIIYG